MNSDSRRFFTIQTFFFFALVCISYYADARLNDVAAMDDITPWSIITVADFHGAETFSFNPDTQKSAKYKSYLETLEYINKTYGGEVILLPGDSNSGKWYRQSYIDNFFPNLTPSEVVYKASINCYTTLRKLFNEAGYENVLMALGDHELGDNRWFFGDRKTSLLNQYRKGFQDGFNSNQTDKSFLYEGDIVGESLIVPTTPWGTDHEKLSYAHQHKNVLFITIDLYEQISTTSNYVDKANGRGGEGTVTGTMIGDHLVWFENILRVATEESSSIDHIIVQGHMPVLEPVRKVKSSAMSVDDGEESEFWKLMVQYGVDLYVAGEVHSTTASKDKNSDLVQIVSRGNGLNGFLKIEVDNKVLRVRHYHEVGLKPKNNNDYEQNGLLVIDKTGNNTDIQSSGVLEILDLRRVLIRFTFEKLVPMGSRQVPGMKQMKGNKKIGLIANTTEMRGVTCTEALPNIAKFGRK